jgi:hypothetical protein
MENVKMEVTAVHEMHEVFDWTPTVLQLDPRRVRCNPENIRSNYSSIPELLTLVMAAQEIQQVCFVIEDEVHKGNYVAIEGNRRSMVANLILDRSEMNKEELEESFKEVEISSGYEPVEGDYLGMASLKIPAIALSGEKAIDQKYLLSLQLVAGISQETLSQADQAEALLSLKDLCGSVTALKKEFGIKKDAGSMSHLKYVYKKDRLDPILQLLEERWLDAKAAYDFLKGVRKLGLEPLDKLPELIELVSQRRRRTCSQALVTEYLEILYKERLDPDDGDKKNEKKKKELMSTEDCYTSVHEAIAVLTAIYETKTLDAESLQAIAVKATSILKVFSKAGKEGKKEEKTEEKERTEEEE